MVNFLVEGEAKPRWGNLADNAYKWAQSQKYSNGTKVQIEYTMDGKMANISRISAVGGAVAAAPVATPPVAQTTTQTAPVAPVQTAEPVQTLPPDVKSTQVQNDALGLGNVTATIVAENLNAAVAQALIALQGRVTEENVVGLVEIIYNKLYEKTIATVNKIK